MLEVGILKTWDSVDYQAGVQLMGSLTTYFDNLSVARNIPASAMVPGNYVIVAIPQGNPKDACVIASWPGGSSGVGVHGNEYHDPDFANEAAFLDHSSRHEFGGADELYLPFLLFYQLPLWNHFMFLSTDGWTDYVTGSAFITRHIHMLRLDTALTSGSVAASYITPQYYIRRTAAARRWRIYSGHHSYHLETNSEVWFGLLTHPTGPTLPENHIAWHIINEAIHASCGTSTATTDVDTGEVLPNLTARSFLIKIYANSVEFYIDNILKATITTNLPDECFANLSGYLINNAAEHKFFDIFPFDIWAEAF